MLNFYVSLYPWLQVTCRSPSLPPSCCLLCLSLFSVFSPRCDVALHSINDVHCSMCACVDPREKIHRSLLYGDTQLRRRLRRIRSDFHSFISSFAGSTTSKKMLAVKEVALFQHLLDEHLKESEAGIWVTIMTQFWVSVVHRHKCQQSLQRIAAS